MDVGRRLPEMCGGYPEVTKTFDELITTHTIIENTQLILERLFTLMYDRTSDLVKINEARKVIFTKKSRTIENIPPTKVAHQAS